jgi:hypothetical protein
MHVALPESEEQFSTQIFYYFQISLLQNLVPTLNTTPHSRDVQGTFLIVGADFVRLRIKVRSQASVAKAYFCCGLFSGSGRPEIFWGGETSDNHLVQGPNRTADCSLKFPLGLFARLLRSSSCTLILSFLFEQPTPFPHIPLVLLRLHHTLQQSASEFKPKENFWLLKIVSPITLHR